MNAIHPIKPSLQGCRDQWRTWTAPWRLKMAAFEEGGKMEVAGFFQGGDFEPRRQGPTA
jgi:hypothetical protein